MKASDFHPGDGVVYRSFPGAPAEDGTVVRCTDSLVFVLYRGDTTPKATPPSMLSRVSP